MQHTDDDTVSHKQPTDLPHLKLRHHQTPSPDNYVGIRRPDNPQPLLRFGHCLPAPPSGTATNEHERVHPRTTATPPRERESGTTPTQPPAARAMSVFTGDILDAAGVLDEAEEHAWRGFGGPGRRQQLRACLVQRGTILEQLGSSAWDVANIASSQVATSRAAPCQLQFALPERTPTIGMGGPGILEDERIREGGPSPQRTSTAHCRTRST
eukprot:397559-Rhodomonas_salina.1